MAGKSRQLWSEEELIAALSLYCQLPFGRMHSTNPHVIQLAEQLGRTSSAVAMKLTNYASFDPYHEACGVSGMGHASKLDRKIWDEYYGKWKTLQESYIYPEYTDPNDYLPDPTALTPSHVVTEAVGQRVERRGQGFFRNAVLSAYNNQCCLTGIACDELLRASHIVPWSSSEQSRLDPCNGLCLNALHDQAFDRGLITISSKYKVILTSRIKKEMPQNIFEQYFEIFSEKPIKFPERFMPSKEYLEYHQENIFISN